MGKVPWGSMLGSMLVSIFQGVGLGEIIMGKVPWGSMLGSMLGSLSGYGGGHHGKGTVEGFHARSVLYSWQSLFFGKIS